MCRVQYAVKISQCTVCSVQFVVKELTSPPTDATSGHHKCSGGGAIGSAKITSALACTWSPQLGHHKFLRGVSRGSLVQRLHLLLLLPSVPVVNLTNLQRLVGGVSTRRKVVIAFGLSAILD